MADPAYPDALPALSRLHWYVVERVLGQGGFGITYLARDTNLDQPVAIKEYLPVDVATRMGDSTIRSRTEDLRDRYRWGLDRFIQEARTLARFDHPNIVRVQSVFEFNNTAYMVMRFEKGMTLSALLDRRGTLPERELLRILLPILDGLELIHNAGFIHRDVKPDNIHIGEDGNPVLLDFGSARQSLGSSHTLTILVAPGYAPFEQYYSDSTSQGPWTDIYGLGATCYRAIAGRPPLDAVSRSKGILGSTQEIMVPASVVGAGRYSGSLLAAIDHALAFAEKDRPQSIAAWRRELVAGHTQPPAATALHDAPATTPPSVSAASAVARAPAITAPPVTPPPVAAEPTQAPARAVPAQPRDDASKPAKPRSVATILLGVLLVIGAGIGVYIAQQRSDETSAKISALEKQFQERIEAERVAKQKADEQKEGERKAQERAAAEDKAQVDARKRDEEQQRQEEQRRQDLARIEESKRREASAPRPSTKDETRAKQAPVAAPVASERAPKVVATLAPSPESVPKAVPEPSPTVVVVPSPEPPKSTPLQRTPADELKDGERALADKKYDEAVTILTRAALQGEVGAQVKLGAMYAGGTGVERNPNLAYVWYGIAARLGNAAARTEQDKAASALQPAEKEQADKLIEGKIRQMPKKP